MNVSALCPAFAPSFLSILTMDTVDDSELWISDDEEVQDDGVEEELEQNGDPTGFTLGLARTGQSGGKLLAHLNEYLGSTSCPAQADGRPYVTRFPRS